MTCDDCINALPFYVGGQLPPGEETEVAGHLAGCDSCRKDLAGERTFARRVHNATVPFRDAALRMERRLSAQAVPAAHPRRPFAIFEGRTALTRVVTAASILLAAAAAFILMRTPGPGPDAAPVATVEELTTWAVGHFPLIDQTHPLRGDAGAVRLWFKVHHAIDVAPPRNADYSTLAGCKMAELDAEPAPLLRFEGKDTSAVFLLPARLLSLASSRSGTFRKDGFILRLWAEGEYPYLDISRDPSVI